MKKIAVITGSFALMLAAALSLQAADQTTKFTARSGSKIRLEGTSNIHDWQVEGSLIGGSMEVGPGFPTEPGQAATPGKAEAKVNAFVAIRTNLRSIEKDGKLYSDAMDNIMYEKLKAQEFPKIYYSLDELVLKEAAKAKDAPYVFDAKGKLAVAGVTNQISMPVSVLPLGQGKLKISGTTTVKMTDFKVQPPAPTVGLGLIKTGDDVKIIFDWMVAQQKPAATASK